MNLGSFPNCNRNSSLRHSIQNGPATQTLKTVLFGANVTDHYSLQRVALVCSQKKLVTMLSTSLLFPANATGHYAS